MGRQCPARLPSAESLFPSISLTGTLFPPARPSAALGPTALKHCQGWVPEGIQGHPQSRWGTHLNSEVREA